MKKLIFILAFISVGFVVSSAFSDVNSSDQNFGRICCPPVC